MKHRKAIIILLIVISASNHISLIKSITYALSDEIKIEDKLHIKGKFEPQLWKKMKTFQSNGTVKDLSLIIWLVENEHITGMQIGQLKNHTVSLFTTNHNANVYSVCHCLPIVMVEVSAFESERIAAYKFVESIEDGDRIGYTHLDVSKSVINADDVETQYGYDGTGITIAILDTGINDTHPDLDDLDDDPNTNDPKIIESVSFVDWDEINGPDVGPQDIVGHGTLVAGVAAGTGKQQDGLYKGVAPNARLMNIKVAKWNEDTLEPAGLCEISDIINGIDYAISEGADIISMSLGVPLNYLEETGVGTLDGNSILSRTADKAVENGIVFVTCTGNNGIDGAESIEAPSDAFNVITVGAIDDHNNENSLESTLADFSSRGPAKANVSSSRPKPDVVAPGVNIIAPIDKNSKYWQAKPDQQIGDFYRTQSGTSMAAPHVAGTAALMLQANPDLTPAQVKAILRQTAKLNNHLSGLTINDRGWGIVDAYDAVELAQNIDGIDPSQMYDPFSVETLKNQIDWASADYITFNIDAPNLGHGFSISAIRYHYGIANIWTDHKLLSNIRAPFVWVDDTLYDLGNNLHKYLLSGPRIYALGPGYVWLRAIFKVNSVIIEYESRMGSDYMGMGFFVTIYWASSQKTLISISPDMWENGNFPQLRSTDEIIYYERKATGDTDLNIRDLSHTDYLRIEQNGMNTIWILRNDYTGSNPDSELNDEYTYNRGISVCYQGTQLNNYLWIYRPTNSLPYPEPPPSKPDTPQGDNGYMGQTLSYSTRSTDPYGDTIHYEFDWGDGNREWTEMHDSGYTVTLEHSWTWPGTYDVRVRAEDSNDAWSDWSDVRSVIISSSGGCPTLFTWNGTDFTIDNNLLSGSAGSGGAEVEDYYRLEQNLVPVFEGEYCSYYSLLISEFQQEHSYLDEVQLFAVDHQDNISIGVTPTGEILTYQSPNSPFSVVDENHSSWLDELSEIDDAYYEGFNGSYITCSFWEVCSSDAKLIIRTDPPPGGPPTKTSIHVQIQNESGGWIEVASIIPRTYWATDILDLSDYLLLEEEFVVRLCFTANHRIDFVGLDTTSQAEIDVEVANLLLVYHSDEGFVTSALRHDDDVYVELVPDQHITLLFVVAKPDDDVRTFIFYVKGYYTIIIN